MNTIKIENIIKPKILKKKSVIYQNENNITLCPICKEDIPLIRPVLDRNYNIKLIFTCFKLFKDFKFKGTELYNIMKNMFFVSNYENKNTNNIYIQLAKNLSLNKTINQNIYEIKNYLEFLEKIKFENNNPCYFHSNIFETIYCMNCDKYFCKECEIYHNDLQQEHTLSKKPIKINEFCLDNIFDYSNIDIYPIKCYCQICKKFFCLKCKNSICNSEFYNNEEHIFLSMNSIYQKENNTFKLNNLENKSSIIIQKIKNKNNNLLNSEIINSFSNENKNELIKLIKKNEDNNTMIQLLGEKIYQTFLQFNNNPNYTIIQNLLNFYNFKNNFLNDDVFEANKINKDYLFNYYNNNYYISFPYFKKFKCISERFQSIDYIIKNENNTYALFGTYNKEKSIIFLDNKINPILQCNENNIKGEVTAMLFMKNKYLILAHYDNINKESKLKIYNIDNQFQYNGTNCLDQNKISCLCEEKDNYFFSTSLTLKLWMIKEDSYICINEIKNYNIEIYYIIKYENNFFYTKGNKVKKFKDDFNDSIKTNIKHWNKITFLFFIKKHNHNNLLLTSGNDFRIILWSFELNNNEYNNVSELFFDNQIKCINKFNENIFCCEIEENILCFLKIDFNNLSLKRIWYYNLYEYQLGKCFYIKDEDENKNKNYKDKICFIIKNNNEENIGLTIFEETEKKNNIDNLNEIVFY